MFDSPEARFALDTVQKVSLLLRQIQQEMVSGILTKGDQSPVTVADFAAQALVARFLQDAFPEDPLVAEEQADALQDEQQGALLGQVTSFVKRIIPQSSSSAVCEWIDRGSGQPAGRFWTLDPVDGTKGFLRGEQYALALALIVDGQVRLGLLGCPHLSSEGRSEIGGHGSLVIAEKGRGTWASPLEGGAFRQWRVSSIGQPRHARLLRSLEASHTNEGQVEDLVAVLGIQAEPIRMDSQAKYGVLAAGQGDLLVRLLAPSRPDYREKIWDQAAGALVIEQAGGRVTDLSGKTLDFTQGRTLADNRGILASNGKLHEAALEALAAL